MFPFIERTSVVIDYKDFRSMSLNMNILYTN